MLNLNITLCIFEAENFALSNGGWNENGVSYKKTCNAVREFIVKSFSSKGKLENSLHCCATFVTFNMRRVLFTAVPKEILNTGGTMWNDKSIIKTYDPRLATNILLIEAVA